ncbi:MAG TPA: hypothetical protein VHA35_01840 [Dongiaceae bacterium]|jgi:hypothetical protein|nr:hypothetical protein [Dongiaceae bacterium]
MAKALIVAAGLGAAVLLTGCLPRYHSANYLGSQVIIDREGNRIEESRWKYPDGKEVTVVDVTPPGSNERRRTEPPQRLIALDDD